MNGPDVVLPSLRHGACRRGCSYRWLASIVVVSCLAECALAQTTQPARGRHSVGIMPVLQRMASRDRSTRYAAAVEAWKQVRAKDREVLEEAALGRHGERARLPAIILLGKLLDRASIPPLETTLREAEERRVRQEAARVLGLIGDAATHAALAKALTTDPDTSVRKFAAIALGRLGDPESLRVLQTARREEPDSEVRIVIRETLSRLHAPRNQRAPLKNGEVTEGFLKGTRYLLYVPRRQHSDHPRPLLVSVHGTHGGPEGYIRMCLEDAERNGLVVLAPHFDFATFPEFGSLNPWIGWDRADLRLLAMVDEVAKQVPVLRDRLYLFGHSQGGHFVQRFVLAHPDRVQRAAASASGQYVESDPRSPFPWGVGRNPLTPDLKTLDFDRLVTSPLAIVIGAQDAERRIKKAEQLVAGLRAYADKRKLPCRVEFIKCAGNEHRGSQNFPAAAEFLFRELQSSRTVTPD